MLRDLLEGVASKWYVRKHASTSFNVGPVGILYIGYLTVEKKTEIKGTQSKHIRYQKPELKNHNSILREGKRI